MYMIYAKKRQKCLFNDDSLTNRRPERQLLCSRDAKRTVLISIVTATATSAIKNVKKKKKKPHYLFYHYLKKDTIF